MHMVGHQHVSMDSAAELGGKFLQVMQVELEVFFGVETYRTVVAALDDVPGDAGDGKACAARHGELSSDLRWRYASRKRGLSPIPQHVSMDSAAEFGGKLLQVM